MSHRQGHRIVEFAAVEVINGELTGRELHSYFDPQRAIDPYAERVHGLSRAFLANKPLFSQFADELLAFIKGADLLMHNASFDAGFIDAEFSLAELSHRMCDLGNIICTMQIAKQRFPRSSVTLDALIERSDLGVKRGQHSALEDARLLAHVYLNVLQDRKVANSIPAKNECTKPSLPPKSLSLSQGNEMHTSTPLA